MMEKKARFMCKRRSTLELEKLLSSFFDERWEKMSGKSREAFIEILKLEDRQLEGYIFKGEQVPAGISGEIIAGIRSHLVK